ncbi:MULTISPECIES: ABC transporter substrate-binding protein [unclassified Shinella]|uniref:ABC transporter substrate-binding protein n=1 Tax=unclassified Shinella TaxID=2643062 RepID=UPI00234E7AAE|nr:MULTISPECIES: extracellular solute-binding protein [unclassified Shinella]MDC7259742.1 extracellular solute-binding protein [Shinella sp. YE25]MDC7267087.1 extracellular solute-binding protein [Shinella sp. HY16]MDC7273984.1 extracellular solute-binding protein [Shinella sp. YZ44]
MIKTPFSSMSRRQFLAGSTALGTLALTGAGGALAQEFTIPEAIAPITGDGPLRWIDSGDQKAVFYRAFFPEYGAARGIEVVYDGLPWNEIGQVLPLGIRNGTAQDAFCLPLGLPPAFAINEGWVQALDDYIPDIESWKAGFPAGAFLEGLNVFDGKTYGLPYTSARVTSAHVLYNRQLLNDAGFDPEAEALTWDSFREAARKVTELNAGRAFGFIMGGNQVNRFADITRSLANMAGTACGDTSIGLGIDFRTGEPVFDSDEFVGAVELLIAMQADGSVFPGAMSLNAPQARAMMPQGAAGLILQGPWNIPQWERENPDFDFGIAPTPAPAGATGNLIVGALAAASNTMFINSKAKNPQAAADVFHYLGTEQGQIDWGNVVGPSDPPIFPAAATNSQMSERSKAALAMFERTIKVGPNPFARNPQLSEVASRYKEPTPNLALTVQGLFTAQVSNVKEQLTALVSATNAALDEAFAAAKEAGAEVSRDDLVFSNWRPDTDYVAADYEAL